MGGLLHGDVILCQEPGPVLLRHGDDVEGSVRFDSLDQGEKLLGEVRWWLGRNIFFIQNILPVYERI